MLYKTYWSQWCFLPMFKVDNKFADKSNWCCKKNWLWRKKKKSTQNLSLQDGLVVQLWTACELWQKKEAEQNLPSPCQTVGTVPCKVLILHKTNHTQSLLANIGTPRDFFWIFGDQGVWALVELTWNNPAGREEDYLDQVYSEEASCGETCSDQGFLLSWSTSFFRSLYLSRSLHLSPNCPYW